ncbi:NUDIX hydrolase [Aquabacterium sp.]|uniref:NUDIX hydrolase n=1 Tax=Aquabacterium sp. TaxID=1872578 RepID=UPI002BD92937|nr:NUDIX hydrolase [Aquabacterium sp.]HSW07841.1 NUDIX hydrolase [Aquabacterium sp.]
MKRLSCGILVINAQRELLLCHATGTWHWDIPKGGTEPGETPLQSAQREALEETGLRFEADELHDLGRFSYRSDKDLHLFMALSGRFDAATCVCTSHYRDSWGRSRPEMDGFEWTPFERVHRRCSRHMVTLLTQTLSLPGLLKRLKGDPA